MPRTHEIDVERHAVIIVGCGVVTESEMRSGAAALKSDPRLRPDMRILVDFAATELTYGLMRAYQVFSTAGQIDIFKERNAALAWLNEGHPPEKWLL